MHIWNVPIYTLNVLLHNQIKNAKMPIWSKFHSISEKGTPVIVHVYESIEYFRDNTFYFAFKENNSGYHSLVI